MEVMDFSVTQIFVAVFVIYMLNYYNGRQKNQALAKFWFGKVYKNVKEKYKEVPEVMMQESSCLFSVGCTGSSASVYFLCKLELINRADIFSVILSMVSSITSDTVCYEVPISNIERKELVFAIINGEANSKLKYYDDLISLKKHKVGTTHEFVGDAKIFNRFYNLKVKNLNGLCESTLKMMYVTSNISVVPNSNLLVRATFAFDKRFIVTQIDLVLQMIELVNEFLR